MGIDSGDGISVYEDGKRPEEKTKVPKEKIMEIESNVDDNGLEDWEGPVKEKPKVIPFQLDEEEDGEEEEDDDEEGETEEYHGGGSGVTGAILGILIVLVMVSIVSIVVSNVLTITGLGTGLWAFDDLLLSVGFVVVLISFIGLTLSMFRVG